MSLGGHDKEMQISKVSEILEIFSYGEIIPCKTSFGSSRTIL